MATKKGLTKAKRKEKAAKRAKTVAAAPTVAKPAPLKKAVAPAYGANGKQKKDTIVKKPPPMLLEPPFQGRRPISRGPCMNPCASAPSTGSNAGKAKPPAKSIFKSWPNS